MGSCESSDTIVPRRIGLERLPNQPDLKELQEEVRLQHKEKRNQPAEPPSLGCDDRLVTKLRRF